VSFTIGEKVGTYQILEELGRGGMATVYKAYHASLDRHVAIKVMDAAMSNEHDFIERFRREARVIARLDNPHIVPVYDFDEHKGQPYLVLKFIDGNTLGQRLKLAPLSKTEILDIVTAVGSGLQYAHKQGILHRDIKPSNVLIARNGTSYLTDFGLAKMVENSSSLTGDTIVGTPHYISPEQALSTEKLDERTDIYSFGVMIYEMVTGRVPFDADTAFSIIEDHIYTPPPRPTSIKPDLPIAVEDIILKALSKKSSDRYGTVSDLVNAFGQAWISNAAIGTVSSSTHDSIPETPIFYAENGKSFPLNAERIVIGRNSSSGNVMNDIDLASLDTKKITSRQHAAVQRKNDMFLLYDLNSRNGTFVNGERISSREPYTLKPGDVVEFGSGGVKLVFSV
jgi:serine/threonine protein kinase